MGYGAVKGYCNGCGACCQIHKNGKVYTCKNLIVMKPVGEPDATKCAVYDLRYRGMPILMKAPDGRAIYERCNEPYPLDGDVLFPTCTYESE